MNARRLTKRKREPWLPWQFLTRLAVAAFIAGVVTHNAIAFWASRG